VSIIIRFVSIYHLYQFTICLSTASSSEFREASHVNVSPPINT